MLHYFVTNTGDTSTNEPVRLPANKVAPYEGLYWSFGTDARLPTFASPPMRMVSLT